MLAVPIWQCKCQYGRIFTFVRSAVKRRNRQMTAALEQHDWNAGLARRTQALGGGEITAILALAGATDVITFSGGFPDPATFPARVLGDIAQALIASDAAVALQYSSTEGLAGIREY